MGTYVASARGGTTAGSSTTISITVPAGVTTAHTGLLCLAGANPTTPASFTISGGGAVAAVVLAPAAATNMWFAAYKITNVAAGAVLSIVGNVANLYSGAVHFFTGDFTASVRADRVGVSQAFVVATSFSAINGARCWVVASDRAAASTVVSSAVNANANAVTQKFYDDGNIANEGVTSHYLGEFVSAVGASTGTTTVTWNGSSGNAVALHLVEVITRTGQPKVWSGAAWINRPAKVWDGTAWVTKPVKVWNGTSWVLAK